MQSRLYLTCDESAAGYLKARCRTSSRRPEIIPLRARLIRAPIAGVDVTFGFPNGVRHGEDEPGQGGKHRLFPGVEPGIAEIFSRCRGADRVEFYVDPDPNSQLLMTLLLARAPAAGVDHRKLFLVSGPVRWGYVDADTPATDMATPLPVETPHLEAAARLWSAYGAPTPEQCLGLRRQDVALFPFLKDAMDALLDDLPGRDTGLGACERLALTSIGAHGTTVNEVVRAFYQDPARLMEPGQIMALLSSLADGASPIIEGLQGRLGVDGYCEDADAWDAFCGSHVRLTAAGTKVLAGDLDFVEAHGIDRWWGGTHLTAATCWRWDHETRTLTPPAGG